MPTGPGKEDKRQGRATASLKENHRAKAVLPNRGGIADHRNLGLQRLYSLAKTRRVTELPEYANSPAPEF